MFSRDQKGRVLKKLFGRRTVLTNVYDFDGNLIHRWTQEKGSTYFAYDAANNPTNINYPVKPDISFTYGALNRLLRIDDLSFSNPFQFAYKPNGQLAWEDGPWASDTISYAYNTAPLRQSLTLSQPVGNFSQKP